nr:hypothetical protein Itr_chr04CG22670 [Ipomoea trifida]
MPLPGHLNSGNSSGAFIAKGGIPSTAGLPRTGRALVHLLLQLGLRIHRPNRCFLDNGSISSDVSSLITRDPSSRVRRR